MLLSIIKYISVLKALHTNNLSANNQNKYLKVSLHSMKDIASSHANNTYTMIISIIEKSPIYNFKTSFLSLYQQVILIQHKCIFEPTLSH